MESDELKRKIAIIEAMLQYLVMLLVELKIVKVRKEPNSGGSSNQIKKLHLKLEVKFDLKSFGRDTNIEKLNQWLKQLEVFLKVQKVEYVWEKIEIIEPKLERSAFIWWEAYFNTIKNGDEFSISSWRSFKELLQN